MPRCGPLASRARWDGPLLNNLSRWVAAHPVQWGLITALGTFFVAGPLNGLYAVGAVVAPLIGVTNWWVWREGGPGHRWRAALVKRFPPKR